MIPRLRWLTPTRREELARWLESYIPGMQEGMRKAREALAQGVEGQGIVGQLKYWEHGISHYKKLADDVRRMRIPRTPAG